jgi:hypothetical protein
MARKRYTAEEIIGHLRTLEIEVCKGVAVSEGCRKLGITEQSSGTSCVGPDLIIGPPPAFNDDLRLPATDCQSISL